MIFVAGSVFSQKQDEKTPSEPNIYNKNPAFRSFFVMKGFTGFPVLSGEKKLPANFIISKPATFSMISADHYPQHFGFFCKKELQFEKASKIPLRFRLGSLQYNDYLEQKPNAVNPF
ncbi:MAG: hypothetical protein WBO39_01305 [Ferruginibacter sp.]